MFNGLAKNLDLPFVSEALWVGGFQHGYKTAQSKQFSLEDINFVVHHTLGQYITKGEVNIQLILDKLSTQQLPKEFIPEYIDNGEEDWIGDDYTGEPFWIERLELKTITNSEGKQEIQGIYKY